MPWRSVARPEGWRDALGSLAAEMPNFAAVVEAAQQAMALGERPFEVLLSSCLTLDLLELELSAKANRSAVT